MDPTWLWIALALVAVVLVGYRWPVSLDLSARAQGEPDGSWAAAFGLQIGPVALTAVTARGVPLTVAAHLFGKLLFKRQPRIFDGKLLGRASNDISVVDGLRAAAGRLERVLDPAGAVYAVFRAPQRLRIRFVAVELTYSFRDAALTGRLLGAIYALTALLPAKVSVRQNPRWDFDDRWAVDAESRLVVRPAALFLHLLWAVIDRRRTRRKPVPRPRELTSPR
jgi:hypothetical protein